MFIRAKEDFETPTHNVPKGALVDLPEGDAKDAICRGVAVPISREKAIAEITGEVENDRPRKNAKHRNAPERATTIVR